MRLWRLNYNWVKVHNRRFWENRILNDWRKHVPQEVKVTKDIIK
jgi:hypothetical protein